MFSQETIKEIEQTKLFDKQNNYKRAFQISETLAKKMRIIFSYKI